MKKIVKVTIVILNYNSGPFLKRCLASITKSKLLSKTLKINLGLIVVDNNSNDESKQYLRKLKSQNSKVKTKSKNLKLKIIFNKNNLGFAAGNNIGVKEALKSKPDYVFFLNPDTVIFPKTILDLIQFAERNPSAGVVNCREELPNGKINLSCHRGFPTPWNTFCHFSGLAKIFPKSKIFAGYTLGHLLNSQKPHQIDSSSGACMLVRTKAGNDILWWDDDFFFYGEDLDFCYRLKQKGWKIFFLPKTKIIHFQGISSGIKKHSQKLTQAKKETKLNMAKASTQAMKIFYQKHYLKKYPKPVTWTVLLGISILEKIRLFQIEMKYLLEKKK